MQYVFLFGLAIVPLLVLAAIVPPSWAVSPFPANPLELTEPDPLLPSLPVRRSLSPQEKRLLSGDLDRLHQQGQEILRQGRVDAAFAVLNRELRLRRFLGLYPEIRALGRVGDLAWQQTQTSQIRLIGDRLQAIQAELQSGKVFDPGLDPGASQQLASQPAEVRRLLQRALGIAYQQMRNKEWATEIYRQILEEARQSNDRAQQETTLTVLAELYTSWFDYDGAIATYHQLLPLTGGRFRSVPVRILSPSDDPTAAVDRIAEPDLLTDLQVLQRLAQTYDLANRLEDSILIRQEWIRRLEQRKELESIPAIQIAIARHYDRLEQIPQAIDHYQKTYLAARPLLQLGLASESLQRLGQLYRRQQNWEQALKIYQFLLDVEQQAMNVYGRMEAYDQLGEVYLALKDRASASLAFREALAIARQLKFREEYFSQKIETLNR